MGKYYMKIWYLISFICHSEHYKHEMSKYLFTLWNRSTITHPFFFLSSTHFIYTFQNGVENSLSGLMCHDCRFVSCLPDKRKHSPYLCIQMIILYWREKNTMKTVNNLKIIKPSSAWWRAYNQVNHATP